MAAGKLEKVLYDIGYEIVHLMDRGETVDTYRIKRIKDGKTYVAKEALGNEGKEIVRSAANLKKVGRHDNIANIEATIDDRILIMEDAEGIDLGRLIASKGRLDEKTALDVAYKICCALEASHKAGILHRDLSPSNIIVSQDYSSVKVVDFGSSGEIGRSTSSRFTSGYASPSQMKNETLEPCDDLYSLGAVLYMMLKTKGPFDSAFKASPLESAAKLHEMQQNPKKIDYSGIGEQCLAVIKKSMVYEKRQRYQTASEMIASIKKAAALLEENKNCQPQKGGLFAAAGRHIASMFNGTVKTAATAITSGYARQSEYKVLIPDEAMKLAGFEKHSKVRNMQLALDRLRESIDLFFDDNDDDKTLCDIYGKNYTPYDDIDSERSVLQGVMLWKPFEETTITIKGWDKKAYVLVLNDANGRCEAITLSTVPVAEKGRVISLEQRLSDNEGEQEEKIKKPIGIINDKKQMLELATRIFWKGSDAEMYYTPPGIFALDNSTPELLLFDFISLMQLPGMKLEKPYRIDGIKIG